MVQRWSSLPSEPAAASTAESLAGPSPLTFGAAGDGISDDYAAIQSALDASAASGVPMALLGGRYKFGTDLVYDAHRGGIVGVGAASVLVAASKSVQLKVGDRQSSGTMRNDVQLRRFKVEGDGDGTCTLAAILVDGLGKGSVIEDVIATNHKYGMQLRDLDRVAVVRPQVENPLVTAILLEQGLENTYGTVNILDPSIVLSEADSIGIDLNKTAGQASPNRIHTLAVRGGLIFATAGVDGTVGIASTIGADAMLADGVFFENVRVPVDLIGQTQLKMMACYCLDNDDTQGTAMVRFNTNTHYLDFDSCMAQKIQHVFQRVSGTAHVNLSGKNRTNGNVDDVFNGSYGSKVGLDTAFAGSEVLALGTSNNNRLDWLYAQHVVVGDLQLRDGIAAPSTDASEGILYVDNADGDLKVKFGDGTVKVVSADT